MKSSDDHELAELQNQARVAIQKAMESYSRYIMEEYACAEAAGICVRCRRPSVKVECTRCTWVMRASHGTRSAGGSRIIGFGCSPCSFSPPLTSCASKASSIPPCSGCSRCSDEAPYRNARDRAPRTVRPGVGLHAVHWEERRTLRMGPRTTQECQLWASPGIRWTLGVGRDEKRSRALGCWISAVLTSGMPVCAPPHRSRNRLRSRCRRSQIRSSSHEPVTTLRRSTAGSSSGAVTRRPSWRSPTASSGSPSMTASRHSIGAGSGQPSGTSAILAPGL
jgi:hypothetical protein